MDKEVDLLLKARNGDRLAASKYSDLVWPRLMGILRYYVKANAIHSDVVNDVICSALTATNLPFEYYKTWLNDVLMNRLIDHIRMERKHRDSRFELTNSEDFYPEMEDESQDFANVTQNNEEVKQIFTNLRYRDREMLRKRYIEGWSYDSMAQFYSTTIGTIGGWIRKAVHNAQKLYS